MGQSAHLQEATVDDVLDGRYKLRREIARGGHGAVFEAEHLVTRARVAIKTLLRPALDLPGPRERLIREARMLGALTHPNIIGVHDAGHCVAHGPYVVLEMIEGRPLDGILLTRQKLSVGQTMSVAVQLCAALSDVHRHGIVHRDVKPGNVLIARGPDGERVELIDFGIAKLASEEEARSDKLTKIGELIGTIEYMAPEQIMGAPVVDGRADVYALGVLIYECLTGEVPYSGTPTAVIANMLVATPIPSIAGRRSDVSPALEAALRKALEIDPNKRYASAAELARACESSYGVVPRLELLEMRSESSSAPMPPAMRATQQLGAGLPTAAPGYRRQYARAPYVTPVRVLLAKGTTDGRTEDLSEGGVLMVTEGACGDGERIKLRMPLPVSGRVVELEATTKWIKTRRNQRAIGVEFIDAPEDVRAEIRSYVALMAGARPTPPRVNT